MESLFKFSWWGKQYGNGGHATSDDIELQKKLEKLLESTKSSKHFQRNIVRGVEGYFVTGSKQIEIGNKLSDDSQRYGAEKTCTIGDTLSKAATYFGRARKEMENERANLLKALTTQVAEPLRAMVMGAPLEDARHLAKRYYRMGHEAEVQATEVLKRQTKAKETPGNIDNSLKLENAEAKLQESKSNMKVLGNEAVAALAAVESQQQRLTLQRLIAMVESERTYHQKILQIIDQLEAQMVSEQQRIEASPNPHVQDPTPPPPPSYEEAQDMNSPPAIDDLTESMRYYLGEVIHSYQAESNVELNLSAGDYVVVRKVSGNGWAEGECKGKGGWFPLEYIERRERVLARKVIDTLH